jgi:hypothetical protein
MLRSLAENWWLPFLRRRTAIAFGSMAFVWPGLTPLTLTPLWGAYAFFGSVLAMWGATSAVHLKDMRVSTNTSRFGMAFVVVAICGPLHAEEGTFSQRRACEPDVFRLCSEFIPDRGAITNCLQRNKPRLNPDCHAVFDGRESAESDAGHSSPRNKALVK